MPRFLTHEWVAAFNTAVDGAAVRDPGDEAGLKASSGHFTVVQQVHGAPDGDVAVTLVVVGGTLRLQLSDALPPDEPSVGETEASEPQADVTISLSYVDAAALSKGDMLATEALNAGRIRVRGDLSVLVAGQQVLADARQYLSDLAADTTY